MASLPSGGGRDNIGRVVWWLLGVASAIAIAVTGAWARSAEQRVTKLEDKAASQEALIAAITADNKNIISRLDRMESKLDEALAKRR